MWIKICGNTNVPDCLLAAELGVDAVGFVFAEGRRTVTAEQVAAITPELPPELERVGVFNTTDRDEIVRTIERAGLTAAQLHGAVDYALLESLRLYFGDAETRTRLLQVLPWWTDRPAEAEGERLRADLHELAEDGSADAILVDSRTASASGGTGVTFDWNAARGALRSVDYRVVVAGGLTAENVGGMVASLHPWGVDVASGVEAAPGRKDPARLTAFVQAVRRAAL